tara:strand:- start:18 stop:509 length:492 start_codon:yes stop_codon:yes gene_type:complete
MPCTKCENGKYKWGKTGECKYDSKEECEKANPKKYSKMKPTPLGKKSYEEYAKELKEFNLSKVEKVELALIDDFEKKFDTTLDRDLKTSTSLIDDLRKAEVAYNKIESDYLVSLKLGETLLADAKELGVDLPTKIKNKVESAKVTIKDIQANIRNIKKMYNLL